MKIDYSDRFVKYFTKRIKPNPKLRSQFYARVALFKQNPHDPILKDHKLTGKKAAFRSFSITGDIRVVYYLEAETAYFIDIGSHNQVY